jgi:hypothetical protein
MPRKDRKVVLGGVEYPRGKVKLGQVSEIAVLLRGAGKGVAGETLAEASARRTVIWKGLQTGGYVGAFADFEALEDVTLGELEAAMLEVGRAIGYFADPEAEAQLGEAEGAASP